MQQKSVLVMTLIKPLCDPARQWYLLDKEGDIALRIKNELMLGERDDNQLALADSRRTRQWVRLHLNADNELLLTVTHPRFVLQTNTKVSQQHCQLLPGDSIQLPNNRICISDHPFLCASNEMTVTVKLLKVQNINSDNRHLHASEADKHKLFADVDESFARYDLSSRASSSGNLKLSPLVPPEGEEAEVIKSFADGDLRRKQHENKVALSFPGFTTIILAGTIALASFYIASSLLAFL